MFLTFSDAFDAPTFSPKWMLGRALAYIDFLKMIKSANLLIHVLERFGEKIGAPTVIYVNNYGHNNMKPNFNLSLRN